MQADNDVPGPSPHGFPFVGSSGARSPALVLASGSAYRREQLARLGLPFESLSPDVDESARPGEAPDALARRLAADKARAILLRRPGTIVIGSDQVAVLDGTRLGKPGDADTARAQLARSSGRTVEFLTAVHVVDGRGDAGSPVDAGNPAGIGAATGPAIEAEIGVAIGPATKAATKATTGAAILPEHAALDRTRATLRRLDEATIRRYVAADEPLDCAGAFKVESLGIALFERIDGEDPTALVGLPLIATARLLRDCGLAVP